MPNLNQVHLRHAMHYRFVAASAADLLNRNNPDLAEIENENFHLAVEYCLKTQNWELLLQYVKSLGRYWSNTGSWDLLRLCLSSLLENDLQSDTERADALGLLADVEETRGNYPGARLFIRQQITILDRLDPKDLGRLVRALKQAVHLAKLQQDDQEAQLFLEHLNKIVYNQRNYKEQVNILLSLAELFEKRKEFDRALPLCKKALGIAQEIRYKIGEVDILTRLAAISRDQQLKKEASTYYQDALAMAINIGDQQRASEIQAQLSILKVAMGLEIFISYNNRDRSFVEHLAEDLKESGFSVWWDEWEIKVGESIIEKVSDGIKRSAFLAVVLSPSSVQSAWVQREVGSALMKQLSSDKGITILPLLIADCDIPFLLQQIKYADFRQDYHVAFRQLLNALR